MKKQIVFIEPKSTLYSFRIARTLKLKGYETILVCFSDLDKEFFGRAFDKILIFKWSHRVNFKNFIDFLKKIFGKERKEFFDKIKKMNPYIFQITGPDLFSLITMFYLRKNRSPKIYFAYDIWGLDKRNFIFMKNPGIKGSFQKFFEKICFKMADGVLHKGALDELNLLDYKINIPEKALSVSLLDEWIVPHKKKKNKEIHIAYGGGPLSNWKERIPFMKILKTITSQKIHFHTYGRCVDKEDNQIFIKESRENKYYHFHGAVKPDKLNKEISKHDYGILPDFFRPELFNSLKPNSGILRKEMAGKIINYLEAGLPIVLNKQSEFIVQIADENGVGFAIDFDELKNIKEILAKKDYKKLQENVRKFQEKFKARKKIKELEGFYKEVVEKNYGENLR